MQYLTGLLDPGIWGYVAYTFVLVQLTILCVTLYLHRDQAHRALDLHPLIRHACRFWLWLTTGMNTREWVAVHRKHHARCETVEDPHSPQVLGLRKVLLEGAELYKAEARNEQTLEQFGRGTPQDWLERHVYTGRSFHGIAAMVLINIALFGPIGLTIWAVQMAAIPLLAAGIINGVGHHSGYRNFECDDAARNVVPWGVFLGGEELHNNHHAFPSSARFSIRRWEFDIGWVVIRVLGTLRMARVRKVAPQPALERSRDRVDLETVRAVLVNRMHVLRDYSRSVTLPVLRHEFAGLPERLSRGARRLMVRQPRLLDEKARRRLGELLERNQALRTVHEFRERLSELWSGSNVSNEALVRQLREWLTQAEQSGIRSLQDFAAHLRSYTLQPATA